MPDHVRLTVFAVLCALFYFVPSPWLSLPILGAIVIFVCRPTGAGVGRGDVLHSVSAGDEAAAGPAVQRRRTGPVGGAVGYAMVNLGLRRLARAGTPPPGTGRLLGDGFWTRFTALDLAMLVLVLVSLLSLLTADNFGVANREFRVTILEPVVFYFLIRVAAPRRKDLWLLAHALIAAAVVIALRGPVPVRSDGEHHLGGGCATGQGALHVPEQSEPLLGTSAGGVGRAGARAARARRKAAYALAAVPVVACLYLTYSRGAWLLGVPLSILFIALVRKGKTLWGVAGALALILASVIPAASTQRVANLFSMEGGTSGLRLKLWQGTLNMIRDHPIFGVGLDNFLYAYRTRYILPDAWEEPNLSHPHNIILDYWTRLGLLGLVTLAVQAWAFFRTRLQDVPAAAGRAGASARPRPAGLHGVLHDARTDRQLVLPDRSGSDLRLGERHPLEPLCGDEGAVGLRFALTFPPCSGIVWLTTEV